MKIKTFVTGAAFFALNVSLAAAQTRPNVAGGGALPLPEGVKRVVSVDAYNILLAESESDGKRNLSSIIVRHVYSGGIARLFGGTSIPTQQFVSPGAFGGGNGGNTGGFGATGTGNGAQNGAVGGNTGFGGGFGGAQNANGGNSGFGGGFGGSLGAFLMRPVAGGGN